MKKYLLVMIMVLCITPVMAEEETPPEVNNDIRLELTQPKKTINLERRQYTNQTNYDKTLKSDMPQDYSTQNPNTKRSAKFKNKKTYKNMSVGTESTHTTTSDTYSGSNSVYTEYEKKNFKLNSSYTKNTTPNQQTQDKGTVSVTPEYRLNKHVSVQNKYSSNLNDNSKQGEVKLNVRPFKDDRMDLGVGAGQKFNQSAPSSSQVNFSTNIRW